jgi:hypothetical protein
MGLDTSGKGALTNVQKAGNRMNPRNARMRVRYVASGFSVKGRTGEHYEQYEEVDAGSLPGIPSCPSLVGIV